MDSLIYMVDMKEEFISASVEVYKFKHAGQVIAVTGCVGEMFGDDRVHSVC